MATLNFNMIFSFIYCCICLASGQAQQSCPDEWIPFHQSCYLFIDEIVPWTSAQAYCSILHAKMLEVETEQENDFVAAQIRARTGLHAVWQGSNDFLREGHWVFNSNGQPLTWFHWQQGQPDNNQTTENGEDCIQILADGTWDDLWCEHVSDNYPSPACEMDAHLTARTTLVTLGTTVTLETTVTPRTTVIPETTITPGTTMTLETTVTPRTTVPTERTVTPGTTVTTETTMTPETTVTPGTTGTTVKAVSMQPHLNFDPSDKSTFHNTHNLLWKDCGESNAWVRFATFDLTPTPLHIPGDAMLTLHASNGDTAFDRNLALVVSIKKRLLYRWTDMPCTGDSTHQRGSCTYSDICQFFYVYFPGGQCPQIFNEQGLPCTCPFTIPAHKQVNINNWGFTIPAPRPDLTWLATGEYYVKLAMYQTGSTIARMCFEFYLNLSPR